MMKQIEGGIGYFRMGRGLVGLDADADPSLAAFVTNTPVNIDVEVFTDSLTEMAAGSIAILAQILKK